jgi:NADH-quinone oxidoreductase subunit J
MTELICLYTLICSLYVVFGKNPIYCAISLMLAFLGIAGLYFEIGAVYLSSMQVVIYTGAIGIIFIFVLMLINLNEYVRTGIRKNFYIVFAIIFVSILIGILNFTINRNENFLNYSDKSTIVSSDIFTALTDKYFLPFEFASLLLLMGIVLSVFISDSTKKGNK